MERIPSARATGRGMTVMAFEEMDSSDRNRCGSSTSGRGVTFTLNFGPGIILLVCLRFARLDWYIATKGC